jgi:syntaxin-binding protein 1
MTIDCLTILHTEKYPGWKVLIVDEHSMKVVSAAVGMYDIMERKVTIVEALEKKRAPFPDMGAMYLLDPNSANGSSVTTMLQDFTRPQGALYGNAVFLYFLGRLPDAQLEQIKACKPLLKRLKGLVEVNIDFLAKEERAFTLDMRGDAFTSFYLRKGHQKYEQAIADKLVTVCATLNEYPHIRYKNSSNICTSLAATFHTKMDQFVNQNPTWWYHGGPKKQSASGAPQRERGTLLLLDRSLDALSPLMHDFTYQSMVHDLLTMQGDCITYDSEKADNPNETEKKDVLLDERDKLWVELRGKHIAQVIETLSERIRDITSSSTGNALNKKSGNSGGNMSLSQMASALKALPEYREVMSKLSQHMHLSHECMDVFRAQNLLSLSELEQTLATGKDEDGNTPKTGDVMDQVEAAMARMKNPVDRLRLLLIATISQGGLRSDDRRLLMNAADLSRDHTKTLNSLEMLGISIFSTTEKNKLVSMMLG